MCHNFLNEPQILIPRANASPRLSSRMLGGVTFALDVCPDLNTDTMHNFSVRQPFTEELISKI